MSDETSAAIAERVVDAIAAELRRTPWFMWDKKAQHAAIACVDAGRAAASSEPRTIPPLTDAECTAQVHIGTDINSDFRHFYALAASRLGATVAAPGVMSEKQAQISDITTDLDAIKREAARKAWEGAAEAVRNSNRVLAGFRVVTTEDLWLARDRYLAAHHPAPVPEPPHVMVNGWRVTYRKGEKFEYVATRGTCEHLYLNAVRLCEAKSMTDDADTDVVRVLALREGRGDGHAES